jgi:hypothetical protein
VYPGALPRVMQPQRPGPQASWAWGYPNCSCQAPLLSTPAYRLEEGGGERGVHVFTGRHHGEVVA